MSSPVCASTSNPSGAHDPVEWCSSPLDWIRGEAHPETRFPDRPGPASRGRRMSLIPIDLRDIALESDLLPADSPASIRIRAQPSARGGELRRLHHEEIGTYAR